MKILLGVDSSSHCRKTVSCLCGMKWPEGTRVVLVSAVTSAEPQYAPEPHLVASAAGAINLIEADYVKTHEALLVETGQTLREAGLETETQIHLGEPGQVLVETARSEGADLIVVGCHGEARLSRRLMGSIASYVVSHAPCNVLVMKQDGPPIG